MNLFDCQFLSSASGNRSNSENQPCSFEFDRMEISNPQSDFINDSSASYCMPEATTSPSPSPTASVQRNQEKRIQRAIYKGPDVFGKVLGPTADESILVGLQALMDMAGTLEFSTSTVTPSRQETPAECSKLSSSRDSRDASEAITQSSASCQCCTNLRERISYSSPEVLSDEFNQEIINEVRPCQYIITQENISAAVNPRQSKCQHSQTRVLPASMTCYNPDRSDQPYDRCRPNIVPCPNLTPRKQYHSPIRCQLRSVSPPSRRQARSPSPLDSSKTSANCPCSQFYHQMTTISVMENSPQESPTCIPASQKRSPPTVVRKTSPICPRFCDVALDTSFIMPHENKSVTCEPFRDTASIPIQTSPTPSPRMCDVKLETDSVVSQERTSVACDCNFCMPLSAGVSKPRLNNLYKMKSAAKIASEPIEKKCICSMCYGSREAEIIKEREEKEIPVSHNKSCVCSLLSHGTHHADAACSSLKVNTSCQYYSEFSHIESRSTQCGKVAQTPVSSTRVSSERGSSHPNIAAESGDCRPHKKKSVRILGGPYECPDISETRYCMEPKKSNSRSVIPLFDDDTSKFAFEKTPRVCLEMGDSYVSQPIEIRYAITKITRFRDFSTFEVMKSTSKKPKCMPKSVEGVFVLKKEENYCNSTI